MSAILETENPEYAPFSEKELLIISDIENQSYDFPWSEAIFRDCMRVGYHCTAMKIDKKIIAYSVFSVSVGEAHILNLCVGPDYKGKGYGKIMLQYVLESSCRLNASMCFLEVRESNQVAINLYYSLGFNQIGIRKDYYPAVNGREDAMTYALQLNT